MLSIEIVELNESVLESLQKLLRSFTYTQIEEFVFFGYGIYSEIEEHGNHNRDWDYFEKVYPCSNFFEELIYAVSRATNEIAIYDLELSSWQFIQLVKAAKKVKKFFISDCKISFDSEFDFGPMEGCLIEEISTGFFSKVYDEWSEHEECLMKIFWGILNCTNMIRSLESLVFDCTKDLKEEMIETAKSKFGENYLDIMPSLKDL